MEQRRRIPMRQALDLEIPTPPVRPNAENARMDQWGPPSRGQQALALASPALAALLAAGAAAQDVIGWGSQSFYSAWSRDPFAGIAAGYGHTVARGVDGAVVAWGDNSVGQTNVPALPPGLTFVAVAAGGYHTAACRSDGSVVAWGYNNVGQTNVPALPPGLTYVEVAAGFYHTVARRSDGSMVAWGSNGSAPARPTSPRSRPG
jgi:hypothetical protein